MTAGRARAFFLANGYSPEAASGIAAGIVAEGGHAGAQNPTSSAYGAGQWLKSHWADFHRVIGRDIHGSSVNDQLRFMLWELSHSENPAGSRIRRARTSSDALNAYVRGYMRPRGGTAGDLQRGSVALAQGGDHKVHVDIRLAGAPSGTAVKVASSHPAVSAGVKVTPTLAGASV